MHIKCAVFNKYLETRLVASVKLSFKIIKTRNAWCRRTSRHFSARKNPNMLFSEITSSKKVVLCAFGSVVGFEMKILESFEVVQTKVC